MELVLPLASSSGTQIITLAVALMALGMQGTHCEALGMQGTHCEALARCRSGCWSVDGGDPIAGPTSLQLDSKWRPVAAMGQGQDRGQDQDQDRNLDQG